MTHAQDIAGTPHESTTDVSTHTAPWPAHRVAWVSTSLLMLAYAFSYIDRGILALVVQPVKAYLKLSDTQIGLLQGPAFGLLFTLTTIPLGWLADGSNRTRLIAGAIAFWSLMTSACGLSSTFAQLFMARMGVAVGESTLSPTAPSLLSDYFPPERRTLPITLYAVAGGVGSGLALVAGGFVATLIRGHDLISVFGLGPFQPWQIIFFAVSAPGLVVSALFLLLREPQRRDHGQVKPTVSELKRVLMSRRAVLIPQAAGICLFQLQAYAFAPWLPAFFMRVHNWTIADVGLRFGTVQVIMGVLGGIVGSRVARRLWRAGRRDANLFTSALCVGAMTLPAIAGLLVHNEWLSLALLGLMVFCGSAPSGIALASIQEIIPNRLRGRVTALYYCVLGLISMTLGPLIIGLMNDHLFVNERMIGVSIAILSAVALPTGSALLVLAGRRRCDIDWVG